MIARAATLRRGSTTLVVMVGALVGCGSSQPTPAGPSTPTAVFRAADCGAVADADVNKAAGKALFTKVVVSDAGCFWQENTTIGGDFGIGMGISTWWYRGSDLDTERSLERKAGRTLTELSLNGNKGFKAYDENACSIYVAKGNEVITWSIQTMNPGMLPDLCTVAEQLAQLSQDRMN
ncbi:MAG: hypothetical protein QOE04_4786 [Mycobacterium sp.]|nr:hypothetical protein [Mycobacterium sp.]